MPIPFRDRADSLRPLFLALALCASSSAQTGSWSDEYDRPGLVGRVFALGEYQSELFAGGEGLQGDGQFQGVLARWDGARWNELPDGPAGDDVRAIVEFGGELVVAGDFSGLGGQPVSSIARWDGTTWRRLGSGLTLPSGSAARVFALAVYHGELYAGGDFAQAGGQPIPTIARWDGTQWLSVGGGITGVYQPHVRAMTVGADDVLYVGGSFDSAGGSPAENIAAWDGSSWSALGSGIEGPVNTGVFALEYSSGKLYAGGNFHQAGGAPAERIAAWDGASWSPLGSGIPDWSISSWVFSLRAFAGELYVGGTFIQAGPVAASRVARWDGSDWSGIGGLDGSDLTTTGIAMTVWDGKLVVGGEFSRVGSSLGAGEATISHSVATFDGAQWSAIGSGLGFDREVRAAVHWNGGIAAVGRFIEAGGALTSQVAFFDGSDWRFVGLVDGNVSDAIVFEGDLVITGDFDHVDGDSIPSIARFDGTSWSGFGQGAGGEVLAVYAGELYAGGLGGTRRWNGAAWESFGTPGPSYVQALHVHAGELFIGGSYSGVNPRIYSWNGTTMAPLGSGVSDSVECITSFGGDLIVGGWFTEAGGAPANTLARWDGIQWSEFPGLQGSLVKSLTVSQGELYAGGNLAASWGDPAEWIARWSGTSWEALGQGLNGTPFTLLPDDQAGKLYVGGLFTKADDPGVFGEGLPSWYFAEWHTSPGGGPGENYCDANANSTGLAAEIDASGSDRVSDNDLTLHARQLPPNRFGYFLASKTQGLVANPGGSQGNLCLGGQVLRYSKVVLDSGAAGEFAMAVDLTLLPPPHGQSVQAGETWNFQAWFRDSNPAPTSNFTDGLSIQFQ